MKHCINCGQHVVMGDFTWLHASKYGIDYFWCRANFQSEQHAQVDE